MKGWLICLLAVACADEGTRARCAEGGVLTQCAAEEPPTAMGACWRLVDCAAIPLHSTDDNVWDWGNCVNDLESLTSTGEELAIECIRTSTCDQLKVNASPVDPGHDDFYCWLIGTGGGR